jgi:hypothetical protein
LKLSRSGQNLQLDFATYLGGNGEDSAAGIAIDTVNAIYVTGVTTSSSFPMTAGAYATTAPGGKDAFVARMHLSSAAVDRVTYASYLGAGFDDTADGIATDTGGHAYVSGSTQTSADPESTNATMAKIKVSSPPAAPVVTPAKSSANLQLTWGAVSGASKYQVFRSAEPYFQAGDPSSTLRSEPAGTSYSDTNVLSAPGAYFYLVKTVNSSPAASVNSNRTGEFTISLVKGTP